jgi:choline dehydrogenase-like flavoprotein
MSTSEHYDVIIIGSGAGGGTLAYKLASTGKRILVLERGGYLKRERENWDSKAIYLDGRYHAHEEWIDQDGEPFRPGAHYFVGGNTKAYGAILFRLRDTDFGEVIHHDGVSPAWPLSYDEFEPYYAEAERLYLVHGMAGEDHTEAWRSGEFPHPPVSHEPRIQQLSDDMERMGLNPFHLPIGIDLDESDPEGSRCIRCDRFDGFPCILDAKADAHICAVRPALQHDNVSLLTHAKVERLETDPSGHTVTDVVVERHGVEQRFSGDIVVVSCGAVNSAALLLKSASDAHPDGLANSSGVVGRHYMCHLNSAVIAVSKSPNDTVFEKTLGCNDFYYGADDFDLPLGHIQMLAKSDSQILKGGAPPLTPGFTLDYVAKHAIDMWLTSEDLPLEQNRVTVDRSGRIHLSYTDSNREPHRRLLRKLGGLMGHLGCHPHLLPHSVVRDKRIPIEGVAHQCGTVRFGDDPRNSALNVDCRAHDVDNLYVVDTSFFPSAGAVNPALTAMANAMRVGDHLMERMGVRDHETELQEVAS